MELSLVIPCYNEGPNITLLMKALSRNFHAPGMEILLVDNGSSDDSFQRMTLEKDLYPELSVRIIQLAQNRGYGGGILAGLKEARGNLLCWTHADLQTDPSDVLRAYDLWKFSKDDFLLVKGKRVGRPFMDKVFSVGMELTSSLMTGEYLREINAQPKLFSRPLWDKILALKQPPQDFSLDLYLLLMVKKIGGRTLEFPVTFKVRENGEAKGGGGSLKTKIKLMKRTWEYLRDYKSI